MLNVDKPKKVIKLKLEAWRQQLMQETMEKGDGDGHGQVRLARTQEGETRKEDDGNVENDVFTRR